MDTVTPDNRHRMIAIPLTRGVPTRLLGECDKLAIFQVDERRKRVLYESIHQMPSLAPGLLPLRLDRLGVDVVLARAAGEAARELLGHYGIAVVLDVPSKAPSEIIWDYLNGQLPSALPNEP